MEPDRSHLLFIGSASLDGANLMQDETPGWRGETPGYSSYGYRPVIAYLGSQYGISDQSKQDVAGYARSMAAKGLPASMFPPRTENLVGYACRDSGILTVRYFDPFSGSELSSGTVLEDGACPVLPPSTRSSPEQVIEQLVRRRLAAVDLRSVACAHVMDDGGDFLFKSGAVTIGDDGEVTAKTGETAMRNVPGTKFIGPVIVRNDLKAGGSCPGDQSLIGDYAMAYPDGRRYIERSCVRMTPDGWRMSPPFSVITVPK